MKPIKMLGLAALAALLAMAFVGASSAMAGTQLCSSDIEAADAAKTCTEVKHIHETTLSGAKATLLSSVINVTCDVLFLGDTLGEGAPLIIHGEFTYTNCNSGSCTVTEESEDSLIEVEQTSHETSSVTGEGEVNVHCGFFINCTYNGEGLEGTGKGPLLSTETNGEVTLTGQETTRVSGFCPEHASLDIKTTPLSSTYITAPLSYCVQTKHLVNGLYNDSNCQNSAGGHSGVYTLVYAWRGWGIAGDTRCYHTLSKKGLYKIYQLSGEGCLSDGTLGQELYENGIIKTIE